MKKLAWIALALWPAWTAAADDAKAAKLAQCMRDNVPPTVRVQQIALTTYDRGGGTREMSGRLFIARQAQQSGPALVHAMLRVDGPASLAGSSYLMRQTPGGGEEGVYMYLPAVKRVRRVSGTFAEGGLMGTDFSYEDFKDFAGAFGELMPRLEVPDVEAGRPVHVLTFSRGGREAGRFRSVRVWLDPATCVPLKAEFHEGGATRKRLTSPPGALRKSGQYYYLSEVTMRDLIDGTRTVMKVTGVAEGEAVSKRYFDPRAFYEGG